MRREPVRAALEWLLQHNPAYIASGVSIDPVRLESIPTDGTVFDAVHGEKELRALSGGASADVCSECQEKASKCTCYLKVIPGDNCAASGDDDDDDCNALGDLGPAPEQARGLDVNEEPEGVDEFGKIDVANMHNDQEGAVRGTLRQLANDPPVNLPAPL